jgi:hypothetical protein
MPARYRLSFALQLRTGTKFAEDVYVMEAALARVARFVTRHLGAAEALHATSVARPLWQITVGGIGRQWACRAARRLRDHLAAYA